MFDHCKTFEELDAAYQEAVERVRPDLTYDDLLSDLAAGRIPPADDGRLAKWAEIGAAMRARWSELRGHPWPSQNTKERSAFFARAARALLEETAFDVHTSVDFAALVPMLIARTGCHADTAKRHLTKAARQLRGEETTTWGGARPGAGRPASK